MERGHRALEHARRHEQVRTGVGVHERDLGETRERAGDIGIAFLEEDALPVLGVRADADIGRDRQVGRRVLHRVDRARHDVIALRREHRRLIFAIRHAEHQQAGKPRGRRGACIANELGDREPLEPWRVGDALAVLHAR